MDLSSSYAGLPLQSPIVIGASPLALDPDHLVAFAEHQVGAVVMPSIFEEQIHHADLQQLGQVDNQQAPSPYPDFLTYQSQLDGYNGGTDGYLRHIESAKRQVQLPIIANVNCMTTGSWMQYAGRIEDSGADAIELNLYHYEVDPQRFADEIERELLERVSEFCSATKLGVSVKIMTQFTCLANIVFRIAGAGAKSVCLFGQIPSIGLGDANQPSYGWELSSYADPRVALDAIQGIRGTIHNLTFAASGGIRTDKDVIAAIRSGADVVMLTSAVYRHGPEILRSMRESIESHLRERGIGSVSELLGADIGGFDPYPMAYRRRGYTSSLIQMAAKSQS